MNSMKPQSILGFLPIIKPKDVSSFYCVRHIRNLVGKKSKVGHTGTLDNFATGLLIICIGREATRLVDTLMVLSKGYKVTAKLGELTDTLDSTGEIILQKPWEHVTKKLLEKASASLGTSYEQTPPIYSALKHEGVPLYKLARQRRLSREELEELAKKKKRTINIYKLTLLDLSSPYFSFYAHVSKGTYIRSLANDIAHKAESCATTYELCRTHIGPLQLKDAAIFENVTSLEEIKKHLISIEEMKQLLSK